MQRFSQSPLEDAFVQDPYPFYERTRGDGDLFYWDDCKRVATGSYRAVNRLLRDRGWGREIPEEFRPVPEPHLKPFAQLANDSMLELDPPRHTSLRRLVNRAFTSSKISVLEPDIRELSAQLVERLPARAELQKSFAESLPVMVIARLLGVRIEMCAQMLAWSHDMVAMYQAKRDRAIEDRAATAAAEFTDFIQSEIVRRRKSPSDDLISRLIVAEDDEKRLTNGEMVSTCILLLNAGHEATANTIGNGVKTIVESGMDPHEILSPDRRAATVEEILRFDPPLHIFERQAKVDGELCGHAFRRGDIIALILAAANRDPAVYDQPDKFIPDRKPIAHTSFGAGIHFCVGAPLARLELAVGLATLFERCPNLSIIGRPRYANRYHFHGLDELWVNLA